MDSSEILVRVEHGAAFGIVYQTSYFALVHRAALQPGETLLVHAAAGGARVSMISTAARDLMRAS